MRQWRVRLSILLGALVVAAPALARPEGATVNRPTASAPAGALDSAEGRNVEGDGGDIEEFGDVEEDAHFGW